MPSRIRTLLSRVYDWLAGPDYYAVQRMSKDGGWRTVATYDGRPEMPSAEAPPDRPGRYRCIEREGSQYGDVVWRWEHPDAEAYYRQKRQEERARARLGEMDHREIARVLRGEHPELSAHLDSREIVEAFEREIAAEIERRKDAAEDDGDDWSRFERLLIASIVDPPEDEQIERAHDLADLGARAHGAESAQIGDISIF